MFDGDFTKIIQIQKLDVILNVNWDFYSLLTDIKSHLKLLENLTDKSWRKFYHSTGMFS